MKRSTWVLAGALVSTGLLFLLTAGLGLHSRSMMGRMGRMGSGSGMMPRPGMIWTMGLWSIIILLLFLVSLIGLVLISSRLIHRSSQQCPNCHLPVQKNWTYCPKCGSPLSDESRRP